MISNVKNIIIQVDYIKYFSFSNFFTKYLEILKKIYNFYFFISQN